MFRIVLPLVLVALAILGIRWMFRRSSVTNRLALAKARFDAALQQLRALANNFFIGEEVRRYVTAEKSLLAYDDSASGQADQYSRLSDELEEIISAPSTCLSRKVYDPVDNALLDDPVEMIADHPTAGRVFVTVNRRNAKRVREIFTRPQSYYSTGRYYQMRIECEAPQDVTVIHQSDGLDLTDAILLHYLLTDGDVHVHHHEDAPVDTGFGGGESGGGGASGNLDDEPVTIELSDPEPETVREPEHASNPSWADDSDKGDDSPLIVDPFASPSSPELSGSGEQEPVKATETAYEAVTPTESSAEPAAYDPPDTNSD